MRAPLSAPAIAVILAACGPTAPSQRDRLLAQERAQEAAWLSLGIHDYAFDTRRVVGNIVSTPANDTMQVIVRRDTIQSVFDVQTRAYVDRSLGVTVPQLFVAARSAIEVTASASAASLPVLQYDSVYHFPTLIASGFPDAGFREASDLLANLP